MPWPTPQDYNEAIQNPRLCFEDPDLRAGTPELTVLGLPRPITGNFASVYRIHSDGRDWAVRCFWREFADLQERYDAISRHLTAAHLPYTVGFVYLPRGILVRGQWYPALKMEWVEGELLSEYVERHLNDRAALQSLARSWLEMASDLRQASIAHGDLQHGNVLVVGSTLKLVDYDGMFVPALAGRSSHELGHQNYQHPSRTERDFGPGLDAFSAWVVYVSLVALAAQPDLWGIANGGDECLLFRQSDFTCPEGSKLWPAIEAGSDEEAAALAQRLQEYRQLPPLMVPPLATEAQGSAGRALPWIPHSERVRALWRRVAPSASVVELGEPVESAAPGWVQSILAAEARHTRA